MGEEKCIDLKIQASTSTKEFTVNKVTLENPGTYPHDGTAATDAFAYPHDEINFPASGTLTRTSFENRAQPTKDFQYCFTPEPGEECVYTTCFQGEFVDSSSGKTGVNCYRIEVHNSVLKFGGAGWGVAGRTVPPRCPTC